MRILVSDVKLKLGVVVLATAAIAGCGSSKPPATVFPDPSLPTGLPTPPVPAAANTYTGGQSPGAWTVSIDDSKNTFSYQPVTYPAAAISGSLQSSGGFLQLSNGGLAYEVPGRTIVLRPGSSTTPPVFAVPQTQCYPIVGKVRFQYMGMFPGAEQNDVSLATLTDPLYYGSVVASTDSTGKHWGFENLQGGSGISTLLTNQGAPPASFVLGSTSFNATCTSANSQNAIGFPSTSLLSTYWSNFTGNSPGAVTRTIPAKAVSNTWVGPSGFFVTDQSDPTNASGSGTTVAGVVEPSSALTTSTIASEQYLGFLYQAAFTTQYANPAGGFFNTPLAALTAPIGFGQVVAGSGSTLTGGIFPNDAVTGTPNSDTILTLGSQDPVYNGLYPSATITVLDPAQNCVNFNSGQITPAAAGAKPGINANGYITCTFPAVAVVGNPEGKYVIFVNSYNWAVGYGGAPMQLYLFQQ
jgi:hypothetical protein